MKMSIYFLSALTLLFSACQNEELELEPLQAPTNLALNADVSTDGSGEVRFDATADGAIVYHYYFGTGANEEATRSSSGSLVHTYRTTGTYLARVVAYGPGAVASAQTVEIDVQVDYVVPANIVQTLTNGATRTWVWKQNVGAHLGVGPADGSDPSFYTAVPNEKASEGCLYEDRLTFTLSPEGRVTMELDNNGVTYFNAGAVQDALGVPNPPADQCYDFEGGTYDVNFFPAGTGVEGSTDVGLDLSGGGFFSYYPGPANFEILSISPQELNIRTIQDNGLAWYYKFIAEDAVTEPEYEQIWSDEFDGTGAPDPTFWGYDIGTGSNGWGNGESQYYTDRLENAQMSDGTLKITAIRENFEGSQFTSARIKTQDKFEFTYGKIDVRAKVPAAGGTWSAVWMLGADFPEVGWPTTGEIDIMEHTGNEPTRILGTVHSPSGFAGNANGGSTTVDDATDEFHVYSCVWTEESITFLVDDQAYYTYSPADKNPDTYPFNKDFFLIMNVAVGGTLGGAINPSFTQDTMEIDYVRVFQER